MTDIASNLDKVIEKLDGMTSEVVTKNYGMDIASKVDHIAKQLDYVQAGGGSGGGSNIMIIRPTSYNQYGIAEGFDKTYAEISECLAGDGIPVLVGFYENASSKYYYYSNSGSNYHEFIALNMIINQGSFFRIDGVRINSDNTVGDSGSAELAVN